MFIGSYRRGLAWAALWGICLALVATSAGGAGRASDWERCRDRVVADLEAKGLREYGDPAAYTGVTGSGALPDVIERCGYRPERLDPELCDQLYRQVYAACREDGFEVMSMAATSWVSIFDPRGPLVARLKRLCAEPRSVDRATFGQQLCGE